MDIIKDNIPVNMTRDSVDGFPQYPLPEGYRIRPYKPGDEHLWYRIEKDTEKIAEINEELFGQQFGSAPDELPRRMFFLIAPDGIPMGTASAWFEPDFNGKEYGRVHWVAIHPEHQGKGLAKPLLSHVCGAFKGLGHARVLLGTSSPRFAAIRTYLQFGFKPDIRTDEDAAVWAEILKHINRER